MFFDRVMLMEGYLDLYGAAVAFVFGACLGSFINAVAMRSCAGRKWWGSERSVCDSCGETLRALEMIPIVSFVALRGRCRRCGARIPFRHVAAEISCAALSAGLFFRWGASSAFAMAMILMLFSLFNSLTDIESGYIFDVSALAPGALALALRLTEGWSATLDGAIGAAVGFGVISVIILVSRGGMGWGDAMLMAGVGAALGWRWCVIALYAGFLIGGAIVIPLILMKRLSRKDAIPLGPFLAVGAIVTLFVGDKAMLLFEGFIGTSPGWPF